LNKAVRVLLLGAQGLLGRDLCLEKPSSIELFPFDRDVDVTKKEQLKACLASLKPNWVINAVGFTHVDLAESKKKEALELNAQAPATLAEVCSQHGVALIHLSTDYVFSGKKQTLYTETDVPDPISYYGETKYLGEKEVQQHAQHYILRTSSLYGLARPNHASRVLEAIQTKKRARAASDLWCNPTYTADLAKWIYILLEKNPPFGIYNTVHKGCCSRLEFAEALCELSGLTSPFPIEPVISRELQLPAPRPWKVCFDTQKWEHAISPLLFWKEGLKNYLKACKSQRGKESGLVATRPDSFPL